MDAARIPGDGFAQGSPNVFSPQRLVYGPLHPASRAGLTESALAWAWNRWYTYPDSQLKRHIFIMVVQRTGIGNPSIDRFLAHCHRRRYPAKSTIICAGDKPDVLYYITKGSVTVLIEDDEGREIVLAYLNAGDFFGEMGLFDEAQQSRSAWVRARSECELA